MLCQHHRRQPLPSRSNRKCYRFCRGQQGVDLGARQVAADQRNACSRGVLHQTTVGGPRPARVPVQQFLQA
ncbi:hypothetical protein G6F32_017409 [Rhizopus arrhizus]|nr:hypothetical protein G6F32_017409 [Rhizopus arrhizus]